MTDSTVAITPGGHRRATLAVAITIAVLAALIATVLSVTGARLFVIETASMAETAPVGTLVVAHPKPAYSVGDVITFVVDGRTVTHRIVGVQDGRFITQGDLNGSPDAWQLTPDQIVGTVVAIVPGLGFLLKAAPLLFLAGIIVEVVARLLGGRRRGWRVGLRLTGMSLAVSALSLWLRPWFNVQMMDFRAADDGSGALMHIVNTGLFPVVAGATRLVSGEDGVILSTDKLASGAYALSPTPDPDWPVRVLLIAFCLVPFFASLLLRAEDPVAVAGGLRSRPDRRARGSILAPIAIVTVLLVVILTSVSTSHAAFAASIRNDNDSAGTNSYFTCRGAVQSVNTLARKDTYAAYSVEGTGFLRLGLFTTESDVSGNARTGTYRKSMTTTTSNACTRDQTRRAVVFDGSQCLYVPGRQNPSNVFTIEAWFSTTSKTSGKIMGFGDSATSDDDKWDRHIYIDTAGRLNFGLFPDATVVIATPPGRSYADGAWHHVAATLSSAGAAFYVDGALVGTAGTTTGQNYTGFWRIGCGNLVNWTANPSSFFTGAIQWAAVHTRALSASEIATHAAAGR